MAGVCVDVSDSSSPCRTRTVRGKCPGPADVRCCVDYGSCDGGKGTCLHTSSCSGRRVAGKCPGPRDIQCCYGDTGGGGGASDATSRHCHFQAPPPEQDRKAQRIVDKAVDYIKGAGLSALAALKGAMRQETTALRFAATGQNSRLRGRSMGFWDDVEDALQWLKERAPVVHIPVHFHVVTDESATCKVTNSDFRSFCCKTCTGFVDPAAIRRQVSVLNQKFKVSGMSIAVFTLDKITYSAKRSWHFAPDESPAQLSMKKALARDQDTNLNMYISDAKDYLGWAEWPYKFWLGTALPSFYPNLRAEDGVVVEWKTLPGVRPSYKYNLGYTAVHEVGHWLGLFHVFQGGCAAPGDHVADTPPQRRPTYGCPTTAPDTCPSAGKDSFRLIMDYSDDRCMTQTFTAGQVERMKAMLVFRPQLAVKSKCKAHGTC